VLVHEAWFADDAQADGNHSSAAGAARIAAAAGVRALVLMHVNPFQDSDAALVSNARGSFPNVAVGCDLDELPLT
jgi:ribonuclease BN (tRNA processing enzyme)